MALGRAAGWLLGCLLLCIQAASAQTIPLAFLPTENRSDQIHESEALAGLIDSVQATAFAAGKGPQRLELLEREAFDGILQERTLHGDGLRPLLASTLLVSSRLIDLPEERVLLEMEAIAADNGRLVHSLHVVSPFRDPETLTQELARRLPPFLVELVRQYELSQRLPLVEVTTDLKSAWLGLLGQRDDIDEAVSGIVSGRADCALLTARHPLSQAEERLLKLLGFTQHADSGTYRPAADLRIDIDLTADPTGASALRSTPVTLRVSFRRNGEVIGENSFPCTPETWPACRDRAAAWVKGQLPVHLASHGAIPLEEREADAASRAEQELALIADLFGGGAFWHARDIRSDLVREAVLSHALRAHRLDPTQTSAAYLAALLDESGKPPVTEPLVSRLRRCDRIVRRCQRCLEQYPRERPNTVLYDYVQFRLSECAGRAQGLVGGVARELPAEPWVAEWARESSYRYRSLYLRALGNMGYDGKDTSCASAWSGAIGFGFSVTKMVLSNCPEDHLDEEYQYWKGFYGKEMAKLDADGKLADTRAAPWPLLDAAFAARRGDSQTIKNCFQEMAKHYPESENWLWQDGRRVQEMLSIARAPDASTWRPELTKPQRRVFTSREWNSFVRGLSPKFPKCYGQENILPVKGGRIEYPEPDGAKRLQVEYVSGTDAFVTPRQFPFKQSSQDRVPLLPLYLSRFAPGSDGSRSIRLTELVPLLPGNGTETKPEHLTVTCATSQTGQAGTVVWLGTANHGLLMCTKQQDGVWTARVLGLETIPALHILSLVRCRSAGKPTLLVSGYLDERQTHVLFTIDTAGGKCRALASLKGSISASLFCWIAELDDGQRIPYPVLDSPPYAPLDVERARAFTGRGTDLYDAVSSFDPATGEGSVWGLEYVNVPLRYMALRQLAPGDCRVTKRRAFPTPVAVPVLLLGDYHAGNCPDHTTTGIFSHGPAPFIAQIVSGQPVVWMVCGLFSPGKECHSYLLGFRPGQQGDPASEDEWIGPFATSASSLGMGVRVLADNRLLLRDWYTCYLADPGELYSAAKAAGQVKTPGQIQEEIEALVQRTGWEARVPAYMATEEFTKAEQAIEAALRSVRSEDGRQRVELWQARLFAEEEKHGKEPYSRAIEAYARIAADPRNGDFARALAFVQQLRLLEHDKRYAEFVRLYDNPPDGMPRVTYRQYEMPGMLSNGFVGRVRKRVAETAGAASSR